MKKFTKLLAVLLCFSMLFCAVACNGDDNDGDKGGSGSGEGSGSGTGEGEGSGSGLGQGGSGVNTKKKISILGDSYSTFGGYVPQGNRSFYNGEHPEVPIELSDMWWHKLISTKGYELEVNQSSSGSPVCNTGYDGSDASGHSFLKRMPNLGNPDIIAVFGGTNDAWAGAPIGSYKFDSWTQDDLKAYRPAFAYMLDYLQTEHPDATIYVIVNSGLSADVTQSTQMICQHYSVECIMLPEFEKSWNGHPGAQGQNAIYEAIEDYFGE